MSVRPRPGIHRRLLRGYALLWAARMRRASAVQGTRSDDPLEAVVLDPFAGADHPLPAPSLPVPVEVLARLFGAVRPGPSRLRGLLLEEDPVKVEWLRAGLASAGLGSRLEPGDDGAEPEIRVLQAGASDAPAALDGTADSRAALVLLDPPGAAGLPLETILALLAREPADLLLRFPVDDLRRVAERGEVPLADLPPYARRAAEGISRLLGDARHGWVAEWRSRRAVSGAAAAEAAMADRLAARIRRSGGRAVRVFEVPAGRGGEAPAELLLLAAAEPGRLLWMNEALHEARAGGRLPWPDDCSGPVRLVVRGELELFGGGGAAPDRRDRVVDVAALAHGLAGRFAGRRVDLRTVLGSLTDTDLFEEDARRALRELRRDGRALYRSLADPGAEVAFPRTPSGGARPRSVRRARGETLEMKFDE